MPKPLSESCAGNLRSFNFATSASAQPQDKDAGGAAEACVEEEPWVKHVRAVDVILGGEKTIALHQEFLIRNNNSDLQILKNTKVRDGTVRSAT